jgi:hypothetical protein
MKTMAVLASALGLCGWACVNVLADPGRAPLQHPEIYQRATREFAEADFLKPAEPKTNDLTFTLAPLILQEVNGGKGVLARLDGFGTLSLSNGVLVLDRSRPAMYWQADTVQLKGKAHARFSYIGCYSLNPCGSERGQSTNDVSLGGAESGLPLQGIRITLSSAGQPVIWEVLADCSGAELIFVSQSLEAAAAAEHGKPLPRRRYAIERGVEEAPEVVVARVIDDGTVAMGPIVYLRADRRAVSTLICRCMPAQVRKLLATSTYDLLPFQSGSTNSLITQAIVLSKERTAFWPGDYPREKRLEKCLRLPDAFSRAQGTSAR